MTYKFNCRTREANTLKALGDLKMRTDDLAGARQDYEQALPIFRQIEARLGEANTLQALGDLKMRTDDLAGARQDYDQALPIFRQIEARRVQHAQSAGRPFAAQTTGIPLEAKPS